MGALMKLTRRQMNRVVDVIMALALIAMIVAVAIRAARC